jgi:hypothetical protein
MRPRRPPWWLAALIAAGAFFLGAALAFGWLAAILGRQIRIEADRADGNRPPP